MDPRRLLDDIDLAQLVAGEVPPGRDDLVVLGTALGALRARVDAEPVPEMAPGLRIQLAEAEARPRPGGPAVVPSAAEVGGRARWRGAVGSSAAALVLVAGVGIAAAQNALPSAVQDAIAASAHVVGIDLPRSHDRQAPPTGTPGGAVPAVPGSPGQPSTPADPPAHGRDGQPGTSSRDGSPSDDAPGRTDGSPADGAPGTGIVPEPTVDPNSEGAQRGEEPAGPDRPGGDHGGASDPDDAPPGAPGGGGRPAQPQPDGGAPPAQPPPGGGGAPGAPPAQPPSGGPPSGGGGQGGPTPMSGEGSAPEAAGPADG